MQGKEFGQGPVYIGVQVNADSREGYIRPYIADRSEGYIADRSVRGIC